MSWPTAATRRLFRVVNGGTPTADPANWDGGVRWATPVDLSAVNGARVDDTKRTLTRLGLITGSGFVPARSLVISTRAPIGYVAETVGETAFNQGCRGLVPKVPVDIRFFRYQYFALADFIASRGLGSTFMELSSEDLAACRVSAPPRAAQQAIADFLDVESAGIDALIAKKCKLTELLSERKLSLVDQAVDRLKNRVPLRRVASRITSGPRGWAQHLSDTGSLFLRIANVQRESIELSLANSLHVSAPNNAEARRVRVLAGDVLVTITADIGSVAVARTEHDGAFVSQHIALITPKGCHPEWLAYCLRGSTAQGWLDAARYGGTKTQLALEDIAEVPVWIPEIGEQTKRLRELEGQLTKLNRAIAGLRRQIALLREHRHALIAAAVTGVMEVPGVSK